MHDAKSIDYLEVWGDGFRNIKMILQLKVAPFINTHEAIHFRLV